MKCPKCNSIDWDWASIGISEAKQCLDCGEIFFGGSYGKPWVKPWREITKGQIDDCLKHSDNYGSTPYDFAWAIEDICKKNNGY
jgi:hypothetical protein